ncbi:MAG: GxxExxY protein [Planctomycetota bacterium]
MSNDSRDYDDRGEYRPRGGGRRGGHRGGHGRGGHRGRGSHQQHDRHGIPLSALDPELTDISRRVIGCAIEVHKTLGPGYPIELYSKALQAELDNAGIDHVADRKIDVEYGGTLIGQVAASLFVEDRFIVDLVSRPGDVGTGERLQTRAKLRSLELELGLIINFAQRRLKDGLVRVLNPDQLKELLEERNRAAEDHAQDDDYEDEYEDDEEYEDEDGDGEDADGDDDR